VTAGNASGIVDGGAAVVVMSVEQAQKRNLSPLGRIVNWGIAGVDPKLMGRGPVPATKLALQRAGLTLDYIDLIEVNEAFAAQYLAVEKEGGPRSQQSQRKWRGDRLRPSSGRNWNAAGDHAALRIEAAQEEVRACDSVHRRRAGDCDGGGKLSVMLVRARDRFT
jgi:hypothetical protein